MRRHEKRDIWKQATLLENGTPICYWELGAFFSWNVEIFTSFSLVLTALSDSAFACWNSILLHCIVLCFHESRFPGIYAATQQSRSQSGKQMHQCGVGGQAVVRGSRGSIKIWPTARFEWQAMKGCAKQ